MAYDVTKTDRKNPNGKVTGFNLAGKGPLEESSDGSVPVEGEPCPDTGNDNAVDKRITDVELLSSTSTSELTAHHLASGLSAVIWVPTVVAPV